MVESLHHSDAFLFHDCVQPGGEQHWPCRCPSLSTDVGKECGTRRTLVSLGDSLLWGGREQPFLIAWPHPKSSCVDET